MPDRGGAKDGVLDWISCTWTVYVGDPAAELPIELGVRSDLPQLHVVGLPTAFLERVHAILLGKTEFEMAKEFAAGRGKAPTNRIAAATVAPREFSVHIFVCSEDFCRLLVATDESWASDVARRWRALLRPSLYQGEPEPDAREGLRESVLRQLANLARVANTSNRKLMVRVEYRRQVKDTVTGEVRGYQETRH
jgi:hypothetical protein